jgi:hypothetical protein
VKRLAVRESEGTADLIASLAELDRRRLYLGEGCPSLFAYCTQVLHLSEHAAYHRIEAARAARRFPLVLERLRNRELTLTAVGLIAPHLTEANHLAVLDEARHQSKRSVEELVARLHPRPDVNASIRKAPERRAEEPAMPPGSPTSPDASPLVFPAAAFPAAAAAADRPTRRPIVLPIAPARYYVQLTVSADTRDKLRRAQELLRHVIPDGDPALVVDRALTALLQQLERRKTAAKKAHAPNEEQVRRAAPTEPPAGSSGGWAEPGSLQQTAAKARAPNGKYARPRASALEPVVRSPGAGAEPGSCHSAGPTRPFGSPRDQGGRRYIPAPVRRAVWARDGGQCTFVGAEGRCGERGFLEFHHRLPFAAGGGATIENVALLCRAHNGHEAERFFGRAGP